MLPNTKKTIFTQCFFYPELLEPFQEFLLVAINKKKNLKIILIITIRLLVFFLKFFFFGTDMKFEVKK